jgi:ABC-type multidrug transport system ATPase subunit
VQPTAEWLNHAEAAVSRHRHGSAHDYHLIPAGLPVTGLRRAADLLERFDLVEAAGRMAATYSGGTRRKLDVAMGLVGDPRVVFVDEPTAGLDPRSRRSVGATRA